MIQTAPGTRGGRGGPLTKRSGWFVKGIIYNVSQRGRLRGQIMGGHAAIKTAISVCPYVSRLLAVLQH